MLRSLNKWVSGKTKAALAALALSAAFTGAAQAAPINYGNFVGTTLMYLGVEENSITDATPLFGAPTIAVDSLVFSPPSFGASSTGGGAPDITDGTLGMTVMAKPGFALASVDFNEAGDYTVLGGGASNFVDVSTPIFVTVLEVDGVAITPIMVTDSMVFTTDADGNFDSATDAGVGVIWTGSVSVDLNDVLSDNGIPFVTGVTKAIVRIDNTLVAISQDGGIAFIQKKQFEGVTITIETVPEPTTLGLLGLGGLFMLRRRPNA